MSTTSEVLSGILWTERHRPSTLDGLALEADTRRLVESYVEAGEIPHLLLLGPAGSGKTTLSRILCGALDCRVLALNASAERGIDTVRDKIGSFAASMFATRWNIVFLDEADALTSDAQTALRNLIEAHADQTRFILTGNVGHKIIGPIQSRCQLIILRPPPMKERFRVLSSVLASEGIAASRQVIVSYADRYTDLRAMLFAAQQAYLASPDRVLPLATATTGASGSDMFSLLLEKNITAFKQLVRGGDFHATAMLTELFWAVPDTHAKGGELRSIVGKGVHESSFTVDPIVLFLTVVNDAIECL